MPRLSVWMIRAALLHLAVGFAIGALLLAHRGAPVHPAVPLLRPAHAELLLLGWTVQLAMGVAFWILPRFRAGPERGDERPALLAFLLLNAGVIAAAVGGTGTLSALSLGGRCAEALAAVAFAAHAWPRVKSFR
ncbi:cbb3-type cytochrome c oxidase subunit I [soil metagenome]